MGSSAAESVTAGIQLRPKVPNNMVQLFVVDNTYDNDTTYMNTAAGTPLGSYSLFNNNCCHWGNKVITASGGSWPIPYNINWGVNPGNSGAQGTQIVPPKLPDPPSSAP